MIAGVEPRPASGASGQPLDPVLVAGESCWREEAADRFAVLVDADSYYTALRQALRRARHSVYILGWDIDSRTDLAPGRRLEGPQTLGALLDDVANRNPDLHVHIASWNYSTLFALERDPLTPLRFEWGTHPRVRFHYDDKHPFGGSQHQKMVVIDDKVAFSGGIDLTIRRWDDPRHLPDSHQRVDPAGKSYKPFHDVHAVVSGEAARALAAIARERWAMVSGEPLTTPAATDGNGVDPWPEDLLPLCRNVRVGIVRTRPPFAGHETVREVASAHRRAIAHARKTIYIEQQYFTSQAIVDALSARLREPDGPDVVLVLPFSCVGWVEQHTMGLLRARALAQLQAADIHRHLRCVYPVVRRKPIIPVYVHAKVMVVDDWYLQVGSANMSHRSTGLDFECDLAVEEREGRQDVRRAITDLRDALVAEHLGWSIEELREHVRGERALLRVIDERATAERTLVPIEVEPEMLARAEKVADWPLDPAEPIDLVRLVDEVAVAAPRRRVPIMAVVAFGAAIVALALLSRFTPLRELASVSAWQSAVAGVGRGWLGFAAVCAAFLLGAVALIPINVLVLATIVAFGGVRGALFAFAAAQIAFSCVYFLGRALGVPIVQRIAGPRVLALRERLARRGFVVVLLTRVLPVAPATVVNLVCGAARVRWRDFAGASAVGTLPGILGYSVFGAQLVALLERPSISGALIVLSVVAMVGGGTALVRKLVRAHDLGGARRVSDGAGR